MTDEVLFTIGEVSDIKGVTVKALRFYEKIGLLIPHRVDPFTKYRYYHQSQFIVIDIIKAARSMEISPNELVPYIRSKDTSGILALLNTYADATREKMLLLEKRLHSLDMVTESLLYAQHVKKTDEIYEKTFPARHVLTAPFVQTNTVEQSAQIISNIELDIEKRGYANTYQSGVIFENQGRGFTPTFYFSSVSEPFDGNNYYCIPSGRYVCVQIKPQNNSSQMKKINRYFKKQNVDTDLIIQTELLEDLFGEENTIEMQFKIVGG
jgi:MerR family transcriptional activator of bmr gene